MIDFKPLDPAIKPEYDRLFRCAGERGCEYTFVNLYIWGRQKAAFLEDQLVFFSQFNRKSVYLFPVGCGDKKPALDAIIQDAKERGIPCRFTGLTEMDKALLEHLYPGKFRFHFDRDSFDYVYGNGQCVGLRDVVGPVLHFQLLDSDHQKGAHDLVLALASLQKTQYQAHHSRDR